MNCGKVLLPTLPQLTGVQQIYPVHPRLEDTTLPLTLVRSLGLKKELRALPVCGEEMPTVKVRTLEQAVGDARGAHVSLPQALTYTHAHTV